MKSKLLDDNGRKTFALVFDANDEVMAGLMEFARRHDLGAAHFTAVGAFRDVTLGYFDWDAKDYKRIPIHEQVEVLSLVGDVSWDEQTGPKVHAHFVVGRSDGSAHGGHLLEAHVRPTLEEMLVDSPKHLLRKYDPKSRLSLIRL